MDKKIRVEEFTAEGYHDAVSVIVKRFPTQAVAVLDKVMANPLKDEYHGLGDILYVDDRPVAFRAATRRKLYLGHEQILGRVRGLTCRLVDSPKDSIARLVEAQKANPRGCRLAMSNTQCVPTEKRAVQNGALLGPSSCHRFLWRAVRPLDCLLYFFKRKILKREAVVRRDFSTLGSVNFRLEIDGYEIRRLRLDESAFYDRLMMDYLESNQGLVSSRTSVEIDWIYGDRIRSGEVVVLGAERDGCPMGYILLQTNACARRWLLGDLFTIENSNKIMDALLCAASKFLREKTPAMMLESIGFSMSAERVIKKYLPHVRMAAANFDSFNFLDAADAERYNELVLSDKSWFFGPYDGDMCMG